MYHCMSCLGYCNYTYLSQLIEGNEEVVEEEILLQAAATAVIIYLGAEEYWALWAKRQQPSWLYLCCPQLMSDPHDPSGSLWQKLYHSHSDWAYGWVSGLTQVKGPV